MKVLGIEKAHDAEFILDTSGVSMLLQNDCYKMVIKEGFIKKCGNLECMVYMTEQTYEKNIFNCFTYAVYIQCNCGGR